MASYTWTGVSGDWNLASDWRPAGGPPKSTDSATINGSATDTITVDTADVANSLTLSDANATLNDVGPSASLTIGGVLKVRNGTLYISGDQGGLLTVGALNLSGGALNIGSNGELKLNGTLTQTGGTLTLYGGTISGGTIDSTAGTLGFTIAGGTLSGLVFVGPLNLISTNGNYVSIALANGTTVVGSSGSGPGTINVTGFGSTLDFDNTQTVSNLTINLGSTNGGDCAVSEDDTGGVGGQIVTLASSVIVDVQGNAQIYDSGYSGDGIVNKGAIKQSGTTSRLQIFGNSLTNSGTITGASSNGSFDIDTATFTNSGTIDVADGDTVTIEPTTFTTTASSVIAVGSNSSLTIDSTNAWTNLGSITLASGASLYLDGSMTTRGLGSITNSGGTVYLEGTLSNSGQTLDGSSLGLALYGGTISGGTVSGLGFTDSGTLSGVTFDGPLNLTSETEVQIVQIANGTRIVGSSGSGQGTINVTSEDACLYFDNTQTVSNVTINLGNFSFTAHLYESDTAGVGDQVLTLASSVTIDVAGDALMADGGNSGDGVVNQGAIDVTGVEGSLTIESTNFTNSGTIDVANGDTVSIEPTNFTTTASSVMTIGANSSLTIDSTNAWTNLGLITLASGGGLVLGGSMSADALGSVGNSGGTVYVAGTWTNSGQTLDGSASFGALDLYFGGTISGGTVTSTGVVFTSSGGTLRGVTFDGPLNLTGAYEYVHLAGGTTVVGSSGSGSGIINLTGLGAWIEFDNTQTIANDTLNLGNSNIASYLYENDTADAGNQVLTLAPTVTVDVSGSAGVFDSGYSGDGVVNQGGIDVTGVEGSLTIGSTNFTNSGTIDVAAGDQMEIDSSASFTNLAAITNDGQIELGGGTLTSTASSASLTNAVGASFYGNGTVTASNFGNSGTIEASGGTLTLTDAVSGSGELEIDAGSNLVVGGAITSGATATFTGANATLTLDESSSFGATIGGLAESDIIDLVGISASGAHVNGSNQLVVTDNGETVDTLQLTGNNSGFDFVPQAVNGGTDIVCQPTSSPFTLNFVFSQAAGPIQMGSLSWTFTDTATGQSDTESGIATTDDAFPLPSGENIPIRAVVASGAPNYLAFNLMNAFPEDTTQIGVLLHGGIRRDPENTSEVSEFSEGCVVAYDQLLIELRNYLVSEDYVPSDATISTIDGWLNDNVNCEFTSNDELSQPTLTVSAPDISNGDLTSSSTFDFDISRPIEKEVMILYSVEDTDTKSITTRQAFLAAGDSSVQIPISSLFEEVSTSGYAPVSQPANPEGVSPINKSTYAEDLGAALSGGTGDHFSVAIHGYEVEYLGDSPPYGTGSPEWYLDSTLGGNYNLAKEQLMFGPTLSMHFALT
jgi:hypothetical protein